MPMAEVNQRTTASGGVPNQLALARMAAERASAVRFADIPAEVVAVAKTHMLDRLGVGLVAASLPRNRPPAALASAFGTGVPRRRSATRPP
jgi:2-methylcitrate dehydratase PrpD